MAHHLACGAVPVASVMDLLPVKYLEAMEQNQLISSCCRHPENHTIEAFYTNEEERDRGIPDLYVFTCTCGKKHRRLCGGSGYRPHWEVR